MLLFFYGLVLPLITSFEKHVFVSCISAFADKKLYHDLEKRNLTLSAKPTKWSNTLKQFVGCRRRMAQVCLTNLWGWQLKG